MERYYLFHKQFLKWHSTDFTRGMKFTHHEEHCTASENSCIVPFVALEKPEEYIFIM